MQTNHLNIFYSSEKDEVVMGKAARFVKETQLLKF